MQESGPSFCRIYVCASCGAYRQYAGWCDDCFVQLEAISAIPVDFILEMKEKFAANSSAVPATLIAQFVDLLIESASSQPRPEG